MGTCNIDHSLADVKQKLADQQAFLPENLAHQITQFLTTSLDQATLNELFHLLKKYDLATEAEQKQRQAGFQALLK